MEDHDFENFQGFLAVCTLLIFIVLAAGFYKLVRWIWWNG